MKPHSSFQSFSLFLTWQEVAVPWEGVVGADITKNSTNYRDPRDGFCWMSPKGKWVSKQRYKNSKNDHQIHGKNIGQDKLLQMHLWEWLVISEEEEHPKNCIIILVYRKHSQKIMSPWGVGIRTNCNQRAEKL